MPLGDRTGPLGLGPGTGRRAGYCAGYPVPGYMNPGISPLLLEELSTGLARKRRLDRVKATLLALKDDAGTAGTAVKK